MSDPGKNGVGHKVDMGHDTIFRIPNLEKDDDNTAPCFGCGDVKASDCNFGVHDPFKRAIDCIAPDSEQLDCPCIFTWCEKCLAKINHKDTLKAVYETLNESEDDGRDILGQDLWHKILYLVERG